MIYPNLRVEMAREDITQKELATKIGKRQNTLSMKLRGKAPITLDEANLIRAAINSDMSLEDLFAVE